MKIAIVGAGYVGLSLSLLLGKKHDVSLVDISIEKVELINKRSSPIRDSDVEAALRDPNVSIRATTSIGEAISDAAIVFIATPTNYCPDQNRFDTSTVESVICDVISLNPSAIVVIKSTVPVGFTDSFSDVVCDRFNVPEVDIFFSPEFLREDTPLRDNLYPSRIIIGSRSKKASLVVEILREGALKEDVPIIMTTNAVAESIKLFANTYLAMRVAFFNELDTFAQIYDLQSRDIIDGVCLDPRIGQNYNNPSFGYGGYCLPKDTQQLRANYTNVPQNLIEAIVQSNSTRKLFIAEEILRKEPETVGVYRLVMKMGSDNFRNSAILDVMKILTERGVRIVVHEPLLKEGAQFFDQLESDLEQFKSVSDVIITNRYSEVLDDVRDKVYSRDVFRKD